MNKDEIIQYNKNVHSFLGYKETSSDRDFYFVEHPETKGLRELNFNRKYVEDWNCIMEVVEAIEKSGYLFEIIGNSEKNFACITIINTDNSVVRTGYYGEILTKKEAVVQAINQFLIWYIENKK